MRLWATVGLWLGQRRRRWANCKPTPGNVPCFLGWDYLVYTCIYDTKTKCFLTNRPSTKNHKTQLDLFVVMIERYELRLQMCATLKGIQ